MIKKNRFRCASTLRLSFALVAPLLGCSPVYQLSRKGAEHEVPELTGTFADVLKNPFKPDINREDILTQALEKYGLTLEAPDFADCITFPDNPQCIQISSGTPLQISSGTPPAPSSGTPSKKSPGTPPKNENLSSKVPLPVAAIIRAAVLECTFWTYNQDTTAVNQTVLTTFLGTLGLGAGVLAATGSSKGLGTAAAAAGAATTVASNWGKASPPTVSVTVHNIVQEAIAYYPLLQLRINRLTFVSKGQKTVQEDRREKYVSVLSEIWDVAGSACPGGVLKGRSWFNGYAN